MPRILIVDDEEDILDLLEYNLGVSGFQVERALSGRLALEAAEKNPPDLVLLDEMLPDLRGFEVLRALRSRPKTQAVPIILLTARGNEADKLIGFELGADDYVTKPFSPGELLARVRAVLKRSRGEGARRPALRYGELEVDLDAHRVFSRGEEVTLTPQEFRLLAFLATHPNRVYNREQLVAHAWDPDVFVDPRTVDVHIRRLRSRLEADPANPAWIETVRGSGYRFNPAPASSTPEVD
jgi:two-component system phosphate regulon response regulator PhoB